MEPFFADINLDDYDYDLPEDRIAFYPAGKRDESRILIKRPDGTLEEGIFKDLSLYVPERCTMVFNDSRVIPARLFFRKPTGSTVELLCLRPVNPADYHTAMTACNECIWECMAGNKRRFKTGRLEMELEHGDTKILLAAENLGGKGLTLHVRFSWNSTEMTFRDIISIAGRTPLPPYIKRPDVEMDRDRYQTIYSRSGGSVAAPTAGLHFTSDVLSSLAQKDLQMVHVTLHVGAGTFLPVKSEDVRQHDMHAEYFQVTGESIRALQKMKGQVLAVGTTAVRTLESLYWLGVKIHENPDLPDDSLFLDQWEPYKRESRFTIVESFDHLLNWMDRKSRTDIGAFTKLMIVPGYRFRVTDVLLTNFHQPRSTLLLLLASFAGKEWKDVYRYALGHGFRFLSYGDATLFFKNDRLVL